MKLRAFLVCALLAGNSPAWAQVYTPYAQQTPEQLYQGALDQVYLYFGAETERLRAANVLFDEAEKRGVPDARIWLGRAELKFRHWRFYQNQVRSRSDARFLLGKVFEKDERFAAAYALLGQIEWSEGCVSCGKFRAEQVLRLDPKSAEGLFLRALSHAAVKDNTKADASLQEAIAIEARPTRRADMMAQMAWEFIARKRPDEAERLMAEANRIVGESPVRTWFRVQYANLLLYERGKPADALIEARLAAKAGSAEAKALIDILAYLDWARGYLKSGVNPSGYRTASATGYLTAEDAFVNSCAYSVTGDIAQALLKVNAIANIDTKDLTSNTALIGAARANNLPLARQLIARKAAVNAQNDKSERPVTFFVAAGNHDAVQLLISRGAEINFRDRDGSSPLSIAVQTGDARMVKLLLGAKARIPDSGNWSGPRLLVFAAQLGNLEIMQALIGKGLDINARDEFGRTPLISATMAGQREIIRYLLDRNADTRPRFMRGTALDYARETGDRQIIELLEKARKLAI